MRDIIRTNSCGFAEEKAPSGAGDERVLFKIASWSIALAFGALLAAMQALGRDASGFSFHASPGTLAAFLLGGAFGFLSWKLGVAGAADTGGVGSLFRVGMVFILLTGVGAFLYPLRFLPADKLREIWIGLGLAAAALSTIGFMLWRIHRFLDEDARQVPAVVQGGKGKS